MANFHSMRSDKFPPNGKGVHGDLYRAAETGKYFLCIAGELLPVESLLNVKVVSGARGEKGDTGFTGATGAKGERGFTGERGDRGDVGPHGERGAIGPKGDKGETGNPGPA